MTFWETVGAAAIGATVPVLLSRFLDWRANRRLGNTGRYMSWVLEEADKNAGDMVERLRSDKDEPR